ncbi:glycerol-3-phosphate 1-O-acyltransferase PlsY [Lactobacillus sp. S2-2]|uniref:glycerol-3-phosphate 1-O-acyltransferase PlsY n=1 Tax=Lactobacillus sp. S2-2 TaxID=2692917 RepID=UPI001F006D5C|nr:glycerol-3-phosphate 1-O-acyltransferase PlsY [Lactobacillus sp. S2-2]MCF6515036.1 glycerol-3-phosphate 1-O-acyltransferase PlsY [Lactobacillus sp. S2-2]
MIKIISLLIIAYLIGSIPSGIQIGKIFFHINVRDYGSGNIGTTNIYRTLGPYAGTAVLIIDLAKGAIATALPLIFGINSINPLLFGLMAVLGHTFSIFDHFKGGKAVATSAGMLIVYNLPFFFLAVFVLLLCITITSMVSFGSILGFIIIAIASLIIHDNILSIVAIILTFFVIYKHKDNIKRILTGKENLVPFGIYYLIKKNKQ